MAVDGSRNAVRDVEHQLVAGSDDLGENSEGVEADFDGFAPAMDVDNDCLPTHFCNFDWVFVVLIALSLIIQSFQKCGICNFVNLT